MDDETWLSPPSIGCDEPRAGTFTGALTVMIKSGYSNVAAGFLLNLSATILGHATLSVWNFGDGTTATNRMGVSHTWAAAGDYPLTLTAYNASNPGGVSQSMTIHVVTQPVHYV